MSLLFLSHDSTAPCKIWLSFCSSHGPTDLALWSDILSMTDLLQVELHHWWWCLWVPSNTSWVGIQESIVNFRHLALYIQLSAAWTLLIEETQRFMRWSLLHSKVKVMTYFIIAEHLDRNRIQTSTYLDKQEEDGYRMSLTKPQRYGSMINKTQGVFSIRIRDTQALGSDRLMTSSWPVVAMRL
jgi:hypothetical protein